MKRLSAKIENILELLGDGNYHELNELQDKTGLTQKQTRVVAEFLTEYGFVEMSQDEKMKISRNAKKLLVPTASK